MALAEYFSKNLLAISQVLKGGSSGQFQTILNDTIVGIAFDSDIKKHEGKAALDLTIRLVTRLYPKIKLIDLGSNGSRYIADLEKLAKAINSKIEFSSADATIVIVIGSTLVERSITSGPIIYIGSDSWIAKFSNEDALGCGDSLNPLGAGIASCIAASNVFRYVFSDFLSSPEFDDSFSLSLISLDTGNSDADLKVRKADIGKVQLAGFGAIGNGFIWALHNSPFVNGSINIIEPQTLSLSNLQRYILAEERHIGKSKLEIAKEFLKPLKLGYFLTDGDWGQYLNTAHNWKNEITIVAIDNAQDRIGIQASLPKVIINGYTENNVLGISRHNNFVNETCVVCTYMPAGKRKSHSQEVADNLNLPHLERQIRDYIFYNKEADDQLLDWVAQANAIDFMKLEKFRGVPVQEFYANVVCGGMLMELRDGDRVVEHIEAPLAFQSAMAGILEFSELLILKLGLRKDSMPNKTQFYPLQSVKSGVNPYNHSFPKDNSGRCICSDQDFISAYKSKWP